MIIETYDQDLELEFKKFGIVWQKKVLKPTIKITKFDKNDIKLFICDLKFSDKKKLGVSKFGYFFVSAYSLGQAVILANEYPFKPENIDKYIYLYAKYGHDIKIIVSDLSLKLKKESV